jgi:hypothetical protein
MQRQACTTSVSPVILRQRYYVSSVSAVAARITHPEPTLMLIARSAALSVRPDSVASNSRRILHQCAFHEPFACESLRVQALANYWSAAT